jgi:hypothetical protein
LLSKSAIQLQQKTILPFSRFKQTFLFYKQLCDCILPITIIEISELRSIISKNCWENRGSGIMGSRRGKKSRSHLVAEEKRSSKNKNEMLENFSLKDVPLAERRREAEKPLYLTRYE